MNTDRALAYFIGFVSGLAIGAGVALLFAPMAGKELKFRIKNRAELGYEKARAEYYRNMSDVDKKLADIKGSMPSMPFRKAHNGHAVKA